MNSRLRLSLRIVVLGLVAWTAQVRVAQAEVVVVPNAQANLEGNLNNVLPFDLADIPDVTSERYQQVYRAADFRAFGGPKLITQVAFRPDAESGHRFSTTLPDVQIHLSTTSRPVNSLSFVFAVNIGSDDHVVYSGPLPLASAFTGPMRGPKDFDVVINLQTPFVYDPGQGNLLLDVFNFDGGLTTAFDAEIRSAAISRVGTLFSGVHNPLADFNDNSFGLITRFTFEPVPEPTTLLLFGVGSFGLLGYAGRQLRKECVMIRTRFRRRRPFVRALPTRVSLQCEHLEDRTLMNADVPYLPPQHDLHVYGGYLTNPTAGSALDLARAYLTSHTSALGLEPADWNDLLVERNYVDDLTGTTHLTFQQSLNGLAVADTNLTVNVSTRGQIINVGGGFVPHLRQVATIALQPSLTPAQAVQAAAADLGLRPDGIPQVLETQAGATQAATLTARGISLDPITAKLQYVPTPAGGVSLAWDMPLRTPDGQHWYHASVDATSGALLYAIDWVHRFAKDQPAPANSQGTADALNPVNFAGVLPKAGGESYRVFARPVQSPSHGDRSLEVNPDDPVASPYGWHDTDGQPGPEFTDTRGNNVDAFRGNFRPEGGPTLTFDFPLDLTKAPLTYQSAATTNLYYWNNILHDVHYRYGFTEAAGNFQVNNYGRGGLGNDPVRASAQDNGGVNNAFFATPPDGLSPLMSMYTWTFTNPRRDGDLDAGIIAHEYGYGVSNRLTGNADGLSAWQSGGLQVGWSDFYAIMFTQKSADDTLTGRPLGTYVLGQPPDGLGARRVKYSYDMRMDPLTLGEYNFSQEFHDAGEIWCSALWDITHVLIEKYGFNPDISGGYTGQADAGNILALRLVMDAMKVQPINPSFLEARDAVLQADSILTGGANQVELWNVFARRGMGLSARDGGANSFHVDEAFDVPHAAGPYVVRSTPSGDTPGQVVSSVRLTFNIAIDASTFTPAQIASFTGPSGSLIPVLSVTPVADGRNAQFDIAFAPQSALGTYTMVIGPEIRDLAGHAMDQNLNGIEGEIPGDQFVARFTLQGPKIVFPAANQVLGPFLSSSAVYVTFDQPIDASTFTPAKIPLFIGPRGPIPITTVEVVPHFFNRLFKISFPFQATTGYYTMVIGPDIRNPFGVPMDQNRNYIPGELPGDQYLLRFAISGPAIIQTSQLDLNRLPGDMSTFRVLFDRPMNPSTFTPDKVVRFTDPNGAAVPVTRVVSLPGFNDQGYEISFPALGVTGTYTMVIGPDIRDFFGNPMDQNGNFFPGEVPGDRFTVQFGVQGPQIVAAGPLTSFDPLDHLTVTFNEPMNPDSFTPDKIASFTDPSGVAIPLNAVTVVPGSSDEMFVISFPTQDADGQYRMVIGPAILDRYGNQMNQDGNLTPGEIPGDQYTVRLNLGTTLVPDGFGYQGTVTPFEDLELFGQPDTFPVIDQPAYDVRALDLGSNTFNFYGHSYAGNNELYVTTSGYLTFGRRVIYFLPTDLTSTPPEAVIAPLWERWNKLVGDPSGPIVLGKYDDYDDNGIPHRLIIEWNKVHYIGNVTTQITFQVILSVNTGNEAGDIVFNYPNLQSNDGVNEGNDCTVGIKDAGVQGDHRQLVNQLGRSSFVGTGLAMRFHKDSGEGSLAPFRSAARGSAAALLFASREGETTWRNRSMSWSSRPGEGISMVAAMPIAMGPDWRVRGPIDQLFVALDKDSVKGRTEKNALKRFGNDSGNDDHNPVEPWDFVN